MAGPQDILPRLPWTPVGTGASIFNQSMAGWREKDRMDEAERANQVREAQNLRQLEEAERYHRAYEELVQSQQAEARRQAALREQKATLDETMAMGLSPEMTPFIDARLAASWSTCSSATSTSSSRSSP